MLTKIKRELLSQKFMKINKQNNLKAKIVKKLISKKQKIKIRENCPKRELKKVVIKVRN